MPRYQQDLDDYDDDVDELRRQRRTERRQLREDLHAFSLRSKPVSKYAKAPSHHQGEQHEKEHA